MILSKLVILSNDTDSFVLLLRYTPPHFLSCAAVEIWLNFGIKEYERKIPMHEVSATMGPAKYLHMVKARIKTGRNIHSKVGTKPAAVQTFREQYLSNFVEATTFSEEDISLTKSIVF